MRQALLSSSRADLDKNEEEGDVNAFDDWCEKGLFWNLSRGHQGDLCGVSVGQGQCSMVPGR